MESVVLGGYQRLIHHAMLLQARLRGEPLFDDEDLVQTGAWRQAFAFDASPTCLLMPFTKPEADLYGYDHTLVYGHICQSLYTASGSVLIRGADLRVVAIHARGTQDFALEQQEIAVESVRPKNAAVIMTPALKDLLAGLQ
jgi:hypothetical protein